MVPVSGARTRCPVPGAVLAVPAPGQSHRAQVRAEPRAGCAGTVERALSTASPPARPVLRDLRLICLMPAVCSAISPPPG